MDIINLFPDSIRFKGDGKYHEIFKGLKPMIINKIHEVLKSRSIKQTTDDQVGHYNYNLSIIPICFSVMYNMLSDLHDPLNRYLIRNKSFLFLIKHLSIK